MTERIPLNKLNGQKIYRNVVKGNMTLQQLAEDYDCSFEQFLAEAKRIIGQFEWSRVEKADKKNQKKDSRKDEREMAVVAKNQQDNEKRKKNIMDEMESVEEKLSISRNVLEDFRQRVPKARKDEAAALNVYQEAVARRQWAEDQETKAFNQVQNYQNRMIQLVNKLAEFDLYLVAPGYKGEIPRGRLTSVLPIEGRKVTVERGNGLLNDISFSVMLGLGFDSLNEANDAIEFAKLVLKYQLESEEPFKVLVDDERIITILMMQEVEF
jgi:hypothetical protein